MITINGEPYQLDDKVESEILVLRKELKRRNSAIKDLVRIRDENQKIKEKYVSRMSLLKQIYACHTGTVETKDFCDGCKKEIEIIMKHEETLAVNPQKIHNAKQIRPIR